MNSSNGCREDEADPDPEVGCGSRSLPLSAGHFAVTSALKRLILLQHERAAGEEERREQAPVGDKRVLR